MAGCSVRPNGTACGPCSPAGATGRYWKLLSNGCPGCGRPLSEAGERYFFLTEGLILCSDCAAAQPAETPPYRLSGAVYAAIAYICTAKPKAIFSFRISDDALRDLSVIAEKHLQNQLERTFPTLEFYKTTRQIPSE